MKDIIGKQFSKLRVLDVEVVTSTTKTGFVYKTPMAIVICNCGKVKNVRVNALVSGNTKSCGCLQSGGNWYLAKTTDEIAVTAVFCTYKWHANHRYKNTVLEFALTKEDIAKIIFKPCHYCGLERSNSPTINKRVVTYNGIDRVDNDKGYTLDNCVPCCKTCNSFKEKLSAEQFLAHVKRIAEHQHFTN